MAGNSNQNSQLESTLNNLERTIDALGRSLTLSIAKVKKAKRAVHIGATKDLDSAIKDLSTLVANAEAYLGDLDGDITASVSGAMSSGIYQKELLDLANDEGLRMIESDGRLLCYPCIVQVSPSETAILIDKKREAGIRPSYVVARLKSISQRKLAAKPDAFLEVLEAAYDLVIAEKKLRENSVVRLLDLYKVLTILPASRIYSKSEFGRDIYLLDQSGKIDARDGRFLKLPASALTRSTGKLEVVSKGGQIKTYAGISFEAS